MMNLPWAKGASCALLVAGLSSFSAPAQASTYTAASCSVSDIQAKSTATSDSDTVRVPAGSCTWTSVLTISKGVTLDGQGAARITFGSGAGLMVNTGKVSAVITGFTFNNGLTNGSYPIAISTSTVSPFNAPFRVCNNILNDDGQQGGAVTLIGVSGFGPGLIDHNTFTTANGADEVIHLLGSGSPSDASGWSNDVEPGGPDMTFLENNVFKNTNTTYTTSAEESYYGARMVFRYNTLSFEQNDIHGGVLSGRWAEIYDNTYELSGVNLANYWQVRGGSGLVFDNISSGSPCCQDGYPSAQFGPDCPSDQCTGAWPIPNQVGTGINQTTSSPVYVWGNDATIDGSTQSIEDSLSYTNGIQAGNTPTSCTHPGGICDVVVTANAPTSWVRCESTADLSAGCPVAYAYSPFAYPHPLDDLSASCVGVGCSPASSAGADAGPDAAVADAALTDAAKVDARVDAAFVDAARVDSGRGTHVDGGGAETRDAGARGVDASSRGSTPDTSSGVRSTPSGGCSCSALRAQQDAMGGGLLLFGLSLASALRRRGRAERRS